MTEEKVVKRNRPKEYKKKKRVSEVMYVRLTKAHDDKLSMLAAHAGLSKSGMARYYIERGIAQALKDQLPNEVEPEAEVKTLDNLEQ